MQESQVCINYGFLAGLAKCIDVSWPITEESTSWKDNNPTQFIKEAEFKKDGKRSSSIKMHCHTGTHVDAPSHFLEDGETIENTSISQLLGLCKVVDFSEVDAVNNSGKISRSDFVDNKFLENSISDGDIVLLKTRNSYQFLPEAKWNQNFVFLDASAAHYLVHEKRSKQLALITLELSDRTFKTDMRHI
jgi:arylformamidase